MLYVLSADREHRHGIGFRCERLRPPSQERGADAARLRAGAPSRDRPGPVLRDPVHQYHGGNAHGRIRRHLPAHDRASRVSGAPLQAALRCHPGATARSRADAESAFTIAASAAVLDEGGNGSPPQKVPGTGAATQTGRTRPVELTSKPRNNRGRQLQVSWPR